VPGCRPSPAKHPAMAIMTIESPRPQSGPAPREEGAFGETAGWLIRGAAELSSPRLVIGELGNRLNDEGVPLLRSLVSIRTLHPDLFTVGYVWKRGDIE